MFELITFIGIMGVYVFLFGLAYEMKDVPVFIIILLVGVTWYSVWLGSNVDFAFKFVWLGN